MQVGASRRQGKGPEDRIDVGDYRCLTPGRTGEAVLMGACGVGVADLDSVKYFSTGSVMSMVGL